MLLLGLEIFASIFVVFVTVGIAKLYGFAFGKPVSYYDYLIRSDRLGLAGKVDKLVLRGNLLIPEEVKSSQVMREQFRTQLGVYFLLVEEHFGNRPPYGVVVLGNGQRVRVENTASLRERVFTIADTIRGMRSRSDIQLKECALESSATPAQCRSCGQRNNCRIKLT